MKILRIFFMIWIALPVSGLYPQVREPEMVLVEGGSFLMGSVNGGGDEKPVHRVKIHPGQNRAPKG